MPSCVLRSSMTHIAWAVLMTVARVPARCLRTTRPAPRTTKTDHAPHGQVGRSFVPQATVRPQELYTFPSAGRNFLERPPRHSGLYEASYPPHGSRQRGPWNVRLRSTTGCRSGCRASRCRPRPPDRDVRTPLPPAPAQHRIAPATHALCVVSHSGPLCLPPRHGTAARLQAGRRATPSPPPLPRPGRPPS